MSEQVPQPDELTEAHELIMAVLDGSIAPEQISRLDELVCCNDEVLRLYSIYVHQQCVVAAIARPVGKSEAPNLEERDPAAPVSLDETMVVRAIRADEPFEVEEEPLPFPTAPPPVPDRSRTTMLTSLAWLQRMAHARPSGRWAAVLLIAVLGVIILLMRQNPPQRTARSTVPPAPAPVIVATLSHAIGAQWDSSNQPQPALGGRLAAGSALTLTKGYAELTFNSGATVVVEAPARLFLKTAGQMTLSSGKLAAMVPPPAHGFSVVTPLSTVTDLGTEFGVAVDSSAETRVDVFKGKVTAQSRVPSSTPTTLVEGNSATVTPVGTRTNPQGAMPQRFVRTLQTQSSALDLVDLLCGGDGTTHRQGTSIDPRSGDYGRFPTRTGPGNLYGDNTFHSVKLPVVSGCFIPNGQTQIDLAGNRFTFTNTHGDTYDFIRAGGPIAFPSPPAFSAVLGGVDYLSPDHTLLFIHSNAGLTLDLEAIRRLHPGESVAHFHTVIGNSAPPTNVDGKPVIPIPADVYAFVDGASRFERRGMTNADGAFQIDFPLNKSDRYLTLAACTDSTSAKDNTIWFNWIVFGDPQLQLIPH